MTIEFVPQVEDKLSPIERLEALCDPGSLTLLRSDVRSRIRNHAPPITKVR